MIEPTVFEKLLFMLPELFKWAWVFFNTSLGQAIVGTFVASFAGVFFAYKIIEKNKRKDDLLRELRATKAAIAVSFEICNSYLNLKEENVIGLEKNYNNAFTTYEQSQSGNKMEQAPQAEEIGIPIDFENLTPMTLHSETLVKQVFEQISPGAVAYTLTNTLIRSMESLNRSIVKRNELIDTWKKNPEELGGDLLLFYLGLPHPAGHTDKSYPDTIKAICIYTENCIYFSENLCKVLFEHGKGLNERLGKDAIKFTPPNFNIAIENGLMPDPKNFKDWNEILSELGIKKRNGADGGT